MVKKHPKRENSGTKVAQPYKQFPWFKVFLPIFIGVSSCVVYQLLSPQHAKPEVDLDQVWGEPTNLGDESIRQFRIEFPDHVITDLKERILHTSKFAPPLEDSGFQYGFNSGYLSQVLDFWKNQYNFKERENFLNKYEHYKTQIQGLDIHFMRAEPDKSELKPNTKILPLLMLHGWPGSIREFYEIIPKLITPRPGYDFVFEVIAPSLPGFGFSDATKKKGLGAVEMAVIMRNLMMRLKIPKFLVQGGDAGHNVGSHMATLFPESVLGFHTNTPVLMNRPYTTLYYLLGYIWPSLVLSPAEEDRMYPISKHASFWVEESGYVHLQATKPDTIGIALTDSPAGLAAYILEKFSTWTNKANRLAYDGNLNAKIPLVSLLDNVMIYWSTKSITTSMRIYAETFNKRAISLWMDEIPTEVPTCGIKFKHDIMYQPDGVLRAKYKNYLRSTVVEDGGHFAALENPDILADDIFEAVIAFNQFYQHSEKANAPPKQNTDNEEPSTNELNEKNSPKTIYDFTVKDLKGQDVSLSKYEGKVLIIVNVASYCGLTEQNYKELNELYEKYYSMGLRILAFPCNQFGNQEPGTPDEIQKFIDKNGIKFDLFEKIEVNGEKAHPLWKFLKESQPGTLVDLIKWNFTKFIINSHGIPVERFAPTTSPIAMESALLQYL